MTNGKMISRLQALKKSVLADGKVSPQEERDFKAILETLDKIIVSAGSLKLWSEKNL